MKWFRAFAPSAYFPNITNAACNLASGSRFITAYSVKPIQKQPRERDIMGTMVNSPIVQSAAERADGDASLLEPRSATPKTPALEPAMRFSLSDQLEENQR